MIFHLEWQAAKKSTIPIICRSTLKELTKCSLNKPNGVIFIKLQVDQPNSNINDTVDSVIVKRYVIGSAAVPVAPQPF